MKTDLRKKAKNDLEKDYLKLMNNAVLGKNMENVRKDRDVKLVRGNYLVSEPNYQYKVFHTKFISNRNEKTEILFNKLSKILMYKLWYNYVNPKYGEKAK